MTQVHTKWSWASLDKFWRRQGVANPSQHNDADVDVEDNPWLAMQSDKTAVGGRRYQVDTMAGTADETWQTPRWVSEDSSTYGLSSDDGTLRQAEGANWRNAFGEKKSTTKRFVSAQNGRWQTGSGNGPRRAAGQSGSTLLFQTLCAVALVGAGLYAQRSNNTASDKINSLYHAAFATDYTETAWPAVEQYLADHHISVPTLHIGASTVIDLHVPLDGKVLVDYSNAHPVMVIEGVSGQRVLSAGDGAVTQVLQGNNGYTVTVDHGAIGVSTYVGLNDVSVKKGQSVSSGQILGHLAKTSHPELQFSMGKDGRAVNPHDKIQFSETGV